MAFPVEVKPVESRRVEYTVTAVGSLEAFERVAVEEYPALDSHRHDLLTLQPDPGTDRKGSLRFCAH